MENVSING